jgi:hypothetical protein
VSLPRLGLLVGVEPPDALRRLLREVADRVRLVDGLRPADDGPAPHAFLWYADPTEPPAGSANAVWVSRPEDLDAGIVGTAAVLLSDQPVVADLAGPHALLVPPDLAAPARRPILPFVRRRLRHARGLPATVIVRGDGSTWTWQAGDAPGHGDSADPAPADAADPVPAELADTATAVASAVIATGPALLTALAWGSPTVTDPASAAQVGATDRVHVVVVADPERRRAAALGLAADDALAAHLGWQGRLLVERRHDLRWTARETLRRLGLRQHPAGGQGGVARDRLEELNTPPDSPARWRIESLVALPGHPHATSEGR